MDKKLYLRVVGVCNYSSIPVLQRLEYGRVTTSHGKLCNMVINPCHTSRHDDVIKWKHFPRYRPFVRGIHRSPVNSPHKGQWRGALMFSLIYVWINGWVNNREAGDQRRYRTHNDVIVMMKYFVIEAPGILTVNTEWLISVLSLPGGWSFIVATCNWLRSLSGQGNSWKKYKH